MVANCNMRWMDNNKIDGNYTVNNEDVSFPFTNALSDIRSEVFRTDDTSTRITIDLGFPDSVNALTLFAPLGEALGISKEAVIKFQADNVNDWVSPEYDQTIQLSSDDRLVFFPEETLYYRFVSLEISDPTNTNGYISFADIFIGDYTTTEFRNLSNGFSWVQNNKTRVSKSLDGTAYFSQRPRYDSFKGIDFQLANASDRQTIQNLFARYGVDTWMPIAIDPGSYASNDLNEMTRLARFSRAVDADHVSRDRFSIAFDLEEVI